MTTGPTLNPEFNRILHALGDLDPTCDYCENDLTGKSVFDIGAAWACAACADEDEHSTP